MTTDHSWAPLVGVCGLAGAGKDEVAKVFVEHGWTRRALADPLRAMLLDLDPLISSGETRVSQAVAHYGWDVAKRSYPEIRLLLQRLGTEVMRKHVGEYFWIDLLGEAWYSDGKAPTVVPDVRYPNEAAEIHRVGGLIIRVTREGLEQINSHATELHANSLPADATVLNSGTLEHLRLAVRTLGHELGLHGFSIAHQSAS